MKEYESKHAEGSEETSNRHRASGRSGGTSEGGLARAETLESPRVLSRIPDVPRTDAEDDYPRFTAPQRWRVLNARLSSGLLLGGAIVLFGVALFTFNNRHSPEPAASKNASTEKPASLASSAPVSAKWIGGSEAAGRQTALNAPAFAPTAHAVVPALNATAGPESFAKEPPRTAAWGGQTQWLMGGQTSQAPAAHGPADSRAATDWDHAGNPRSLQSSPMPAIIWQEPKVPPPAVPIQQTAPLVASRQSPWTAPNTPASYQAAVDSSRPSSAHYNFQQPGPAGANRLAPIGDYRGTATGAQPGSAPGYQATPYPASPYQNAAPAGFDRGVAPAPRDSGFYVPGPLQNIAPADAGRGLAPASHDSSARPAGGYPNSAIPAGYQNVVNGGYSNTAASATYQNVPPATPMSTARSYSDFPPYAPAGVYQKAAPTSNYSEVYPAGATPGSYRPVGGPGGAAAQPADTGVAQFEGGIDTSTNRTTYDRTGSSIR